MLNQREQLSCYNSILFILLLFFLINAWTEGVQYVEWKSRAGNISVKMTQWSCLIFCCALRKKNRMSLLVIQSITKCFTFIPGIHCTSYTLRTMDLLELYSLVHLSKFLPTEQSRLLNAFKNALMGLFCWTADGLEGTTLALKSLIRRHVVSDTCAVLLIYLCLCIPWCHRLHLSFCKEPDLFFLYLNATAARLVVTKRVAKYTCFDRGVQVVVVVFKWF